MPISYDEAWTFLHFTQHGILASASHYPAPNNHVLYSILTSLTYHLPLPDLWNLRLSVLAVSWMTLWAAYRFVRRHFDTRTALVVVAVFPVLFMGLYFSYMARGYGLLVLFFILALHAAFNIVKLENPGRDWFWFALFSILGFYTIPSFLYPFLTLNFFILYHKRKNIWPQVAVNVAVVLAVFVLYLPIICNDGIRSITDNPYVKTVGLWQTLKTLPLYYPVTMAEITGIHWSILIVLGGFAVWRLFKIQDRFHLAFALIFVLAPFVLLLAHRVIPFARVFCYYGFVLVLVVALPFRMYFNRMNIAGLVLSLVALQYLLVLNFNRKIYSYEDRDLAANITASRIIPKIIGSHSYLFNFTLLRTNLEFELVSQGIRGYRLESVTVPEMSADTISGYDYIIINKAFDRTLKSEAVFRTPYYNIYKKIQDSQ